MARQRLAVGDEPAYVDIQGTQRSWDIGLAPRTVFLRGLEWKLSASLESSVGGRYDRAAVVHQEQEVQVTHNIGGDQATLVIQRFVKAVQVQGATYRATSGSYLAYGPFAGRPLDRDVTAFCESKFLEVRLQDDGPRGGGKIRELGELSFAVHDEPGLATSTADMFPYALLCGFILRVTVHPVDRSPALIAEFPYRTYFRIMDDPYPEGFRAAPFVERVADARAHQSFEAIAERYAREKAQSLVAKQMKPATKGAKPGAGGRRGSFG